MFNKKITTQQNDHFQTSLELQLFRGMVTLAQFLHNSLHSLLPRSRGKITHNSQYRTFARASLSNIIVDPTQIQPQLLPFTWFITFKWSSPTQYFFNKNTWFSQLDTILFYAPQCKETRGSTCPSHCHVAARKINSKGSQSIVSHYKTDTKAKALCNISQSIHKFWFSIVMVVCFTVDMSISPILSRHSLWSVP